LTSYQENFGICAVEALACGVPVIVSPQVNLAPEIETTGAGWVAPLEQGAIERTLADVLSDDEGRARRGVAGSELVRRKFSWEVIADKLVSVYEASIRNAPARAS
jgi:glycosyltransferase involved in cell wall biosynthesis